MNKIAIALLSSLTALAVSATETTVTKDWFNATSSPVVGGTWGETPEGVTVNNTDGKMVIENDTEGALVYTPPVSSWPKVEQRIVFSSEPRDVDVNAAMLAEAKTAIVISEEGVSKFYKVYVKANPNADAAWVTLSGTNDPKPADQEGADSTLVICFTYVDDGIKVAFSDGATENEMVSAEYYVANAGTRQCVTSIYGNGSVTSFVGTELAEVTSLAVEGVELNNISEITTKDALVATFINSATGKVVVPTFKVNGETVSTVDDIIDLGKMTGLKAAGEVSVAVKFDTPPQNSATDKFTFKIDTGVAMPGAVIKIKKGDTVVASADGEADTNVATIAADISKILGENKSAQFTVVVEPKTAE